MLNELKILAKKGFYNIEEYKSCINLSGAHNFSLVPFNVGDTLFFTILTPTAWMFSRMADINDGINAGHQAFLLSRNWDAWVGNGCFPLSLVIIPNCTLIWKLFSREEKVGKTPRQISEISCTKELRSVRIYILTIGVVTILKKVKFYWCLCSN